MLFQNRRIGFVGAGNMTESLIAGLLHNTQLSPSLLLASDIDVSRCEHIRARFDVNTTTSNCELAANADILILAVEPQHLDGVLSELAEQIRATTLVVSVAAGYPVARVARHLPRLGSNRIIRAMPNTPVSIHEGVTALSHAHDVPAHDVSIVRALFEQVGKVVVVDEALMDAVTALSGSGPAYVFVMIEALADGGVKMGLSPHTAQLLAAQTVAGASRLMLVAGEHPGVLKDRVTSPGGTTIAGIYALEQGRFRATLTSAVETATKRSIELGLQS